MFWIPYIYGISPSDCPTLISRCLSIHGIVVHLRTGFLLFKQIMVVPVVMLFRRGIVTVGMSTWRVSFSQALE